MPDRLPLVDIFQSFQKQLVHAQGDPLLFYGVLRPDHFELKSIRYSELWTLRHMHPTNHPKWRSISMPLLV